MFRAGRRLAAPRPAQTARQPLVEWAAVDAGSFNLGSLGFGPFWVGDSLQSQTGGRR
jgi:hypothetical protein